jgi:D-lactate dehydrogenase
MILEQLRKAIGNEQVLDSATARYSFASDAGPYLLIPEFVLQPRDEADIVAILDLAKKHARPVVFRAGGTSLSGQSITDGWLVDIGRHWRAIEPIASGEFVRVQPGAIGGMVNAKLKHLGRKIGPDPSSIMSAMMGGILSNNSSGMCCGVRDNAYHTLESVRFILPDGSIWDTSNTDEKNRFEREKPEIFIGLESLRDELRSSSKLADKIRSKYRTKNTVGYGLNAFLDYDHPLDILARLLIGGEGTLAFISQAVLRTKPDLPFKATALAYFEDVQSACESIPRLIDAGCAAIELMDHASLESIRNLEGVPEELPSLLDRWPSVMGILFEFHAVDQIALDSQLASFAVETLPKLMMLAPIEPTQDPKRQYYLWKLRKGMYPAVAAVRARGEAAILEDIAVPVDKLGPAILDLQELFRKHHYENGIIFGHAKDGNLHFVITQSLNGGRDVEKYARFINDMVQLVIEKYDGAIKAEHGTGRNMAPFVETEWGPEAVSIMRRLKKLIDPEEILNPDVILSSKPAIHTANLKQLPVVEDVVDKCIECGACEPRCPSRDFTLSPRQRIVIRRAIARLEASQEHRTADKLRREYNHAGLASCATDGLCAIDCPVAINTGDLVKQLRREKTGRFDRYFARQLAYHFEWAEWTVVAAMWGGTLVNRLGNGKLMQRLAGSLKKIFPSFPYWHDELRAERLPRNRWFKSDAEFIYLPACMSRMMGGTAEKMMRVTERADIRLYLPKAVAGLCCGQAFSSKGYPDAAVEKQTEWFEQAWLLSDEGRLPIIVDLGSCTAYLKQSKLIQSKRPQILDSIEFACDVVLPKLKLMRRLDSIAVHSVCSNQKMGWEDKLLKVANACATKVIQPQAGKCCGMGGDRGFALPALTNSATALVREAMEENSCSAGYTSARSCAIGLSTGSGYPWRSIFHLLDEVSA